MELQSPFQRLQARLGDVIEKTPPGDRLLTEPALAKQLGVSRATLREAMRTFESQGVIRRRQGIGTFVVKRTKIIDSGLEVLQSIETMAKKIGLDVSMGALQIDLFDSDGEYSEILGVKEGTSLVKVSRVIFVESRPVALLLDVLPENILTPADLETGFTGSVLDLLLRRGSPMLSRSLTNIQAEAASSDIARAMQIQRGDVLLMFKARLYDTAENVVAFSTSYFLPGYFHFHIVRGVEGSVL
ncbi:MAG: GntR family transcriptional regulator [Anaerolineaceae bacterium]|nr:GntR family transcriptional regulator [Anaerolineaceae bacterium]